MLDDEFSCVQNNILTHIFAPLCKNEYPCRNNSLAKSWQA